MNKIRIIYQMKQSILLGTLFIGIFINTSTHGRVHNQDDILTINHFYARETFETLKNGTDLDRNSKKLINHIDKISKIIAENPNQQFTPHETDLLTEIIQNTQPKTREDLEILTTLNSALFEPSEEDEVENSSQISDIEEQPKILEKTPEVTPTPAPNPTTEEWSKILPDLNTKVRRQIGIDLGLVNEARADFMEKTTTILEKVSFPKQFDYSNSEIKEYSNKIIKEFWHWIKISHVTNPVDLTSTPKTGLNSLLNHIMNDIFKERPELNDEVTIEYVRHIKSQFWGIAKQHLIWTYQDNVILGQSVYTQLKQIILNAIEKHQKEMIPPTEKCLELLTNLGIENITYDNAVKNYQSLTHDQAKAIYRKRALKEHPDKGGDEEKFKTLGAAYKELQDLKKWP